VRGTENFEKGFGLSPHGRQSFPSQATDIFVTPDTIKRNFLREGSPRGRSDAAASPRHSRNSKSVEKVNDMRSCWS